jgi:tRNA(Arg) A34 adenosine deaminase TadA
MWRQADATLVRCLELAHQSFLAGGLPVGSVIVARGGERISEGRNRAYDPAGGADRLQRTPIAHAEMNALAGIDTAADLSGMTLWSSHRPCTMCAAACEFTGVGMVIFIAPDPSDDDLGEDPGGIAAHRRQPHPGPLAWPGPDGLAPALVRTGLVTGRAHFRAAQGAEPGGGHGRLVGHDPPLQRPPPAPGPAARTSATARPSCRYHCPD